VELTFRELFFYSFEHNQFKQAKEQKNVVLLQKAVLFKEVQRYEK